MEDMTGYRKPISLLSGVAIIMLLSLCIYRLSPAATLSGLNIPSPQSDTTTPLSPNPYNPKIPPYYYNPQNPNPANPTVPSPVIPPPAPLPVFNPNKPITSNPLYDILKQAPTTLPPPQPLKDFRTGTEVKSLSQPAPSAKPLELFGYSYFAPARQMILARMEYIKKLMAQPVIPGAGFTSAQASQSANGGAQGNPGNGQSGNPSNTGISSQNPGGVGNNNAIANLTDAQKLDLLTRERENKLTDAEKIKYHDLLYPASPTSPSQQGSSGLSPLNPNSPNTVNIAPTNGGGPVINDAYAFNSLNDPLTQFFSNIAATVPATYQLSGGDKVTLRYWSPTMEMSEITLTVDQTGGLTIPGAGRIIVQGQTLAQAEKLIGAKLNTLYRDVKVSLSMKELRTMPITVTGESWYPGTYNVPAVATALNMIYATGGPTDDGTLRKIEVRRNGLLVGVIDFYKFLMKGDQTQDIPLQPGDVIYIPPRYSRVTVEGEVRRPGIYELIDHESLADALAYAGGINPSGVEQRVQVLSVQPGVSRVLRDVNVSDKQSAESTPLYDGDIVDVFSVQPTVENMVSIDGAVDLPGDYAITPGMTVSDLLRDARGTLSDAYLTVAHLFRYNPDNTMTLIPINLEKALKGDPKDNVELQRWDKLMVYTRDEVAWTGQREVTVRGAVKKPGIYYRSNDMRVSDLLILAGGVTPDAYTRRAILLHQHPDGSYTYDYVNINAAMTGNPISDPLLQEKDVLAVYRTDEAHFTPDHTVKIVGEVVTPGTYPRGDGMHLSDLIRVAGGLTPQAGDEIAIAHARTNENSTPEQVTWDSSTGKPIPDPLLQDGDVVTIQGRGDYRAKPYIVYVNGEVNRPGPVILQGNNVWLSDVIRDAGGLKPDAYAPGVEFMRSPDLLMTAGQKQIAQMVNELDDLINQSDYQRELAKADVERIKMIGQAMNSGLPIPVPGLATATTAAAASTAPVENAANPLLNRQLVTPPRTLTDADLIPAGNVAINLSAAMKKPHGPADILMMNGDTVTVPKMPTTVQVIGAVMHARGVLYQKDMTVRDYVDQAGGFAPDAALNRIEIIRLGDGLTPASKVKHLKPGDVILVPTQVMAAKLTSKNNLIDDIFRNITNTSLIILVATKLFGL